MRTAIKEATMGFIVFDKPPPHHKHLHFIIERIETLLAVKKEIPSYLPYSTFCIAPELSSQISFKPKDEK
jgi:hypothetical protein